VTYLYTERLIGEPRTWWPRRVAFTVYVPSTGMQYSTVYVPLLRSVTIMAFAATPRISTLILSPPRVRSLPYMSQAWMTNPPDIAATAPCSGQKPVVKLRSGAVVDSLTISSVSRSFNFLCASSDLVRCQVRELDWVCVGGVLVGGEGR